MLNLVLKVILKSEFRNISQEEKRGNDIIQGQIKFKKFKKIHDLTPKGDVISDQINVAFTEGTFLNMGF